MERKAALKRFGRGTMPKREYDLAKRLFDLTYKIVDLKTVTGIRNSNLMKESNLLFLEVMKEGFRTEDELKVLEDRISLLEKKVSIVTKLSICYIYLQEQY